MLYPQLRALIDELEKGFVQLPPERIALLDRLTKYIDKNQQQNVPTHLTFICTHNSRRSHISQIWAQTGAYMYGLENIFCSSGGTEATAFNPRAVKAMRDAGFVIDIGKDGSNPLYHVKFSEHAPAMNVFSKTFDDPINPKKNFAAIMTCSHADENCPFIPGAEERIALTYDDPKDFDGTSMEEEKYAERVREIGREILYAMSRVKK